MNFLVASETKNRLVNASSWSNCLSFMEGTGESILSINKLPDATIVVINDQQTTNCFSVRLEDNNTQTQTQYFIFELNFENLKNWLSQQTGKSVVSIILNERIYVVV